MSRYLSKICDQLVCLLSAEHSEAILWKDLDDDLDESSSLEDLEDVGPHQIPNFTFGKKRKVVVSQGFTVRCLIKSIPPYCLSHQSLPDKLFASCQPTLAA
jgi:hypothetical protein